MADIYSQPLSDDEFVELDELLCSLDESLGAMDAAEMDGFLTGILLLPQEVSPSEWMPMVFSATDIPGEFADMQAQERMEELVYRRYKQIDHQLATLQNIDPITFDVEDDEGNLLEGEDEIVALEPFALGFLHAAQTWPGLLDTDESDLMSALLAIFRHLPEEARGDMQAMYEELQREAPLEHLDDAIADIAQSVKEIAAITRGFQEEKKKEAPKEKKFKKTRRGPYNRR